MPKFKSLEYHPSTTAFQGALDARDVIGTWTWDAELDRVRTDMFVALLFNIDPEAAEAGVPLPTFCTGIHPDDRDRVLAQIRKGGHDGGLYVIEYRVCSADGVTRWVLARGRFLSDHRGRPISGRGIIVDITDVRGGETDAGTIEVAELAEAARHEAEPPLERAADYAMAAHRAICELADPALKARADALLLDLGRKLAEQERRDRRARMN